MHNPALVQVSPDKWNLLFGVRTVDQLEKAFLPIIDQLRLNFGRNIIFCQRQVDCGSLYTLFEQELGTEFTEPVRTHHSLPQYRLVNPYMKKTEDIIKKCVLEQCSKLDSCLRVIICTAAFGMGIDCVGVNCVIHYGPPNDIETYIQQTGRSGRDGQPSHCQLMLAKDQMRFCDVNMKSYCTNSTVCRRDSLYSGFSSYNSRGSKCNCCDICAHKCNCTKCQSLIVRLT